jgi:hypothetical protein
MVNNNQRKVATMNHKAAVLLSGGGIQAIATLEFGSKELAEDWLREHGFIFVRHDVWNCESPMTLNLPTGEIVFHTKFQVHVDVLWTPEEILLQLA